jgi:hypothetical protein
VCLHTAVAHTRAHTITEEEEAEQLQGQALQEPLPAVVADAALLHTEGSVASSSNSEQQQLQLEDAQIDDDNADTDAAMAATVDLAATASDL